VTRAIALAFAYTLLSCVPASEPHPAGAVGFAVEPSASARGEPFENDGWLLTVEKLIIRAKVVVMPVDDEWHDSLIPAEFIFDGSKQGEIFTPALSEGHLLVDAIMGSPSISPDNPIDDQDINVVGVAPADVKRFDQPVVQRSDYEEYSGFAAGPTVLLVVRGQRNATSIELDVAVRATGPLRPDDAPRVEVRANELTLASLDVLPELVFGPELGFGTIASADANSDGVITPDELELLRVPADPAVSTSPTLLDALARRIGLVLLRPRARPRPGR